MPRRGENPPRLKNAPELHQRAFENPGNDQFSLKLMIIMLRGFEKVHVQLRCTPHLSPWTVISPICHLKTQLWCIGRERGRPLGLHVASTTQILIYVERLCLPQGVGRPCSCHDLELPQRFASGNSNLDWPDNADYAVQCCFSNVCHPISS